MVLNHRFSLSRVRPDAVDHGRRERHARAADSSFIGGFDTVSTVSTTIPSNGDVNPYGVAHVPELKGTWSRADSLLVTSTTAPTSREQAPRSCRSQPTGLSVSLPRSMRKKCRVLEVWADDRTGGAPQRPGGSWKFAHHKWHVADRPGRLPDRPGQLGQCD